jgi:tetratricopeptide (TPR) repeat protein
MKPFRWRFPLALLGVGLLALVLRLVYLAEVGGSPLLSVLMGDSRQYDAWARQIAGGQWIGTEVFYQTPLYPYLLAIIYAVAGPDLIVVRVIQAILGAASCVLVVVAGRRFFDERIGVIAGLLLAVYPSAIFFDGLIQKAALDAFLVTLTLALLGAFLGRPHWKWLVAAGAAMAAFTLNRENARVLYPVIAGWLLIYFRAFPIRQRVAWVAIFTAAMLLVLLPVGLRNYHVGGTFLLSTSQAGPNFYIGNNPHASGSYEALLPERGDAAYEREDATRLAEKAAGRKLSASEVSDYWLGRSWDYVRTEPVHWVRLLGKKLLLTLNAAEIADTESVEAYSEYSVLLRALLWLNFGVIFPVAVFGAWARRRDWQRLAILGAMILTMTVAVAAFFVVARYRHSLVPMVLLFSAAGVAAMLDVLPRRARVAAQSSPARGKARKDRARPPTVAAADTPHLAPARWAPGLALAVVAAIGCNVPMRVAYDETHLNLGSMLILKGRSAEAIAPLERAVADESDYPPTHYYLGLAYSHTGEQTKAAEQLTTALRLRPDYAEAHNALALLLRQMGRTSEAFEHFQQAVRFGPDSAEVHANFGLALMEAGDTAQAVTEYRAAVRLNPGNASAHNNLAGGLQQMGALREAIAEYQAALALKPDYAEAHSNLALALASVQDYTSAIQHLSEAARLQPANYGVRMNLAALLAESGRPSDAVAEYERAASLSPDSFDAPYLAAQVQASLGRLGEALVSLDRALKIATASGSQDAVRQVTDAIRTCRAQMATRGR